MGQREDFEAYITELFDAAKELYKVMIAQYVAEQLDIALSPGGDLYEQLMIGAVSGAAAWYGMYSPEVYQRAYSMTNPANIKIDHSITVNGASVTGQYSVSNQSPKAGYAEGFWFYKRGKRFWRPGGDLMQDVPDTLDYTVTIPQDIADSYFGSALAAVM